MTDAVDVVVAGHSHSLLDTRVRNRSGRGTKLVVEASPYGEAYDRIELKVDRASGDVVAKGAEVRRTWHDRVVPHRGVAARRLCARCLGRRRQNPRTSGARLPPAARG